MSFAKVTPSDTNDMQKTVCLSNIAKKRQWDHFFNHLNVVVLTEEQNDPQRIFRQERSYDIRTYERPFFYCFIDNKAQISLYIVFNSKAMINKARIKEKVT